MQTVSTNISSTDTHTAAMDSLRVLIAAGGTGGHVYPGIAIGDALKRLGNNLSLLFVGTRDRMEAEAVPAAGYDFKTIWISGFHRNLAPGNLLFPFKLAVSLLQSIHLIRQFRPHVVVSCGGFASGPVGWIAARMGIPLVIQEQNSYPGVTTRLLARHAERIFTAFPDAEGHLPKEKIVQTGNPLRTNLESMNRDEAVDQFRFKADRPTLLVMGGSGGARTINDAVETNLADLHDSLGLQIIWQCGKRYYEELRSRIPVDQYSNLRLLAYIDNMPAAYAASDLVVSRAGALSCSELMLTGKPSILIPSPNVAGDHQTRNAASMVDAGAALYLKDDESIEALVNRVGELVSDRVKLDRMSRAAYSLAQPDAAAKIAEQIKQIAHKPS